MAARATKKKTAKKPAKKAPSTTKKRTTKKAPARKSPSKKSAPKKPAAGKPTPKQTTPWTFTALMAELKRLGTEQNRKVYARHGAPAERMFGVSFANIYALQKQIKRDHALARALWDSGNIDAQILGALIADADAATRAQLESWARSSRWFMGVDYLGTFVATTPHALPLARKWMKSRDEFIRRAGYSTLNALLKNGAPAGAPPDTPFLEEVLATIEREIHDSPNRAREAMNTTLICIGVYHDPLHKQAVAAAKRIGFVAIDHAKGTNCKDFIATEEIAKARAHRAKKAAPPGAKRK